MSPLASRTQICEQIAAVYGQLGYVEFIINNGCVLSLDDDQAKISTYGTLMDMPTLTL